MSGRIQSVAQKELSAYFASPVAFIFIGTFLFVSFFTFFWVENFFVRNITDVRPLFEWMPILLIFLVSSLTMRQWSEELRSGTVEFLLTMPIKVRDLVLGKFLACLALVSVALLLTLSVPISVSFMGNLDWGPVFGAYLASILLAGAYIAIGLFVSSRTDSQIVSLTVSILVCFALYLLGSNTLVNLMGNFWSEVLRLMGTGSRFESINRGMIDIRDLYYYLSIIGVFLALNVFTLERRKWDDTQPRRRHKLTAVGTALLVINFLIANFWLHQTTVARIDLTEGNQYTVSPATRDVLQQLQEPLLIRGYFSAKTHPLLAPLVPQIRDMIREYELVGSTNVQAEFIDPREHPELEEEANRKYNIKPIPFQVSDRYQASLVNSYFDVLIQYGDKFEVLNFRDLIEMKATSGGDLDVRLRNLEYDLTRAIKKVLYGFQSTEGLLASLTEPVTFTAYMSPREELPAKLAEFRGELETLLDEFASTADGSFTYELKNPRAGSGELAQEIEQKYGFRPMITGLFDTGTFYFYMVLKHGDEVIPVDLPENLTGEGARQSLETALKRFSPGFLKTVGLVTPPTQAANPMLMQAGLGGKQFTILRQKLEQNHTVTPVDLASGVVPTNVDLLLVVAPEDLDEKAVFAIDQFVMKGGTAIFATSPISVTRSQTEVSAKKHTSGLEEWFKHNGIVFTDELVLDTQNEPYPVPIRRNLGGFTVEEIQLVQYPPYVDIRGEGLAQHGITAGIQQVTLNWPSPVTGEEQEGVAYETLLQSSPESWTSSALTVQPDFKTHPKLGFPVVGPQKTYPLGILREGTAESFFAGKQSPLLSEETAAEETVDETEGAEEETSTAEQYASVIERSSGTGRLLVFASNEFLEDQTLQISAGSGTERYLNSLLLIENAIDWSLEDPALLTIRNRGHFSRTLLPLSEEAKMFWEYGNYAFAVLGLLLAFGISRSIRSRAEARYSTYLPTAA